MALTGRGGSTPLSRMKNPLETAGSMTRARRLTEQLGGSSQATHRRIATVPFTLRNLREDLEDVGSNFDGAPRAGIMRLRGVEPPRPFRATRPSTLRVYQFRHSRENVADSSAAPA